MKMSDFLKARMAGTILQIWCVVSLDMMHGTCTLNLVLGSTTHYHMRGIHNFFSYPCILLLKGDT